MHTFLLFFGWPDGGVWSNLLASAIVGVPAYIWAKRKVLMQFERRELNALERHADTSELIKALHRRFDRLEGGNDDHPGP